MLGGPGRHCVVLMNQSSRDHTLLGVRPSPGPGRGAVSRQSSRDEQRKRSLPGTTVRKEGRAISSVSWHSSVTAEEMTFGDVEGDEIVFCGQASARSRAFTERQNLPPAVTPHRTYSDVRIDLRIEAEIDPEIAPAIRADVDAALDPEIDADVADEPAGDDTPHPQSRSNGSA
jgi:hypothetical protein